MFNLNVERKSRSSSEGKNDIVYKKKWITFIQSHKLYVIQYSWKRKGFKTLDVKYKS